MASNFTSDFWVVPIPDKKPSLWPAGWRKERQKTGRDLTWVLGSLENPKGNITVPKGYEFDGASVPVPFSWIYPRASSKYQQAAAVHDYIYEKLGNKLTRKEADQIFYDGLIALNIHWFHASVMYYAVRIGGGYWWHRRWTFKKG